MKLFDTTLRDGCQSANVNLSGRDKIDVVKALDDFGIDYVELGWPASNDKEMNVFLEASKLNLKNVRVVAFGSTRRIDAKAEDDVNLKAILQSKAKTACVFGKTWLEHVKMQLKAKPEDNLEAIRDSVDFLKKKGLEVIYDLEHFFDGFKDNKEYALKCVKAAALAKADYIVMCDTNGGNLVSEVSKILQEVNEFVKKEKLNVKLGVHFHNDSGVAVANSLVSVEQGVSMIQGTINGFGERTGNADLCQIIPNLMLKKKVNLSKVNLKKITEVSDLVYTLANVKPNKSQPFVGRNAFSHKGGVHVDALMKGASYEHIDMTLVGNKRKIILSELSGKANIVEVLKKFNVKVSKDHPNVQKMLEKVEELERKGYDIGTLPAEQFLLKEEFFGKKGKIFEIKAWKILSEVKDEEFSECVLSGKINGKEIKVVAPVKGGPVDAVYSALKKMIEPMNPKIVNVQLINYKVMIAEDKGAESSVRVYIEFKDNGDEWGTVGVSTNILEASLEAIEKGFKHYLLSK
ncbi:MAG: citramalate synthase [Nanoarchaeota archaeon]|nr:citramalate synthase [Nanoarchaeota archaeon]MBU1004242.1 citramalate synthase [Nanoarchaeota archaeon]